MKRTLANILRSPIDRSPLTLDATEEVEGEIRSGHLVDASGNEFPIMEGVPFFAEAAAEDETFAFKWSLIGDSYGYDEQTRLPRQNWYLERFGFGNRQELLQFLRSKPMILDAGTGTGVDAAMFAESASNVVAVDLCRIAALAAYRHIGHLSNVHVLQADLRHLPFPRGIFDYVSCDQVLHHTPDPVDSFSGLVSHLRQGGHIAVYVYRRKGPIREFTDDYLRGFTTKMTAEECYQFSRHITLLGKALSGLKADVVIPEDIPLLGIKSGREDVQRFFYWNVMKCFWNDDYDLTTNSLINFDWYHAKHASRHTAEEVRDWFEQHELEIVAMNTIPSGIAALGRLKRVIQGEHVSG